ncbi:hypothetical protein L4Z64_001476 [Pseudomonas aeruginosa]|nr:hypothetical protein [Pseudomonas aeruginosa]
MVEIIEVPPQELPKQITAKHVAHSLGEHLEAFLAANNMTGWQHEEDYVLRDDRLGDQLLLISQSTGLSVALIKRMAKRLKKLGQANGAELKLSAVQEMLAHALGYRNFKLALVCRTVDDFIENIWPMGAAMSLESLNKEGEDIQMNPALRQLLKERIRFNRQRDSALNDVIAEDPKRGRQMKKERLKRQKKLVRQVVTPRNSE